MNIKEQRSVLIQNAKEILRLIVSRPVFAGGVLLMLGGYAVATSEQVSADQAWRAVNADTINNGTVPEPTPTPESTPRPEAINRVRNQVFATDANGQPKSGVRVMTVAYSGNDQLKSYLEGGWKGAPANITSTDENGLVVFEDQFAYYSQEQAIIFGKSAEDTALGLSQEQYDSLRPHQPLENVTIVMSDIRQDEAPAEVSFLLTLGENGEEHSLIGVVKNNTYRAGYQPIIDDGNPATPPIFGQPIEIGEHTGFLEPIQAGVTVAENEVMTATINTTNGSPSITFQIEGETITVSNELTSQMSAQSADSISPQQSDSSSDLLVTAFNSQMVARQNAYEESVNAQGGVAGIASEEGSDVTEPKLQLKAIRSSSPNLVHSVEFNQGGDIIEALVTDVQEGDTVVFGRSNGQLEVTASGLNGHQPNVVIVGQETPVFDNQMYMPNVSR